MEVLTLDEAKAYLKKEEEKRVADYKADVVKNLSKRGHFSLPNTRCEISHDEATLSIRFHHTVIIEVKKDTRKVTLATGGWKTATTKSRMNVLSKLYGLGFRVYAKTLRNGKEDPTITNATWFVQDKSGQLMIFCEGIEIDY